MTIETKHKFLSIFCIALLLPTFFIRVAVSDAVLCIGEEKHIAVEAKGFCTEYWDKSVKTKARTSLPSPNIVQGTNTLTPCSDIPLLSKFLDQTNTKTRSILSNLESQGLEIYTSATNIHSETLPFLFSLSQNPPIKTSLFSSLRTTVLLI